MLDEFDLSGRAALVTGGNHGIGRGIAVFLASHAADFMTGRCLVLDGGVTIMTNHAIVVRD